MQNRVLIYRISTIEGEDASDTPCTNELACKRMIKNLHTEFETTEMGRAVDRVVLGCSMR
jgi:hypothetical protein